MFGLLLGIGLALRHSVIRPHVSNYCGGPIDPSPIYGDA